MCNFNLPCGQRLCPVGAALRNEFDAAIERMMGMKHPEDRAAWRAKADKLRVKLHQHIAQGAA